MLEMVSYFLYKQLIPHKWSISPMFPRKKEFSSDIEAGVREC